ncbi:MAG: DUF2202 domain-containing protein [Thermoleophilia bacterium]|nr:DUF2202 domain-containing protein [Thermoleophilia bacterium]
MKRYWKPVAIAVLALVLVLAVGGTVLATGSAWKGGDGSGAASSPANGSAARSGNKVLAILSDQEKEALLFMREEEKLARDVYTVLYAKWGEEAFENIARSESRHMESVRRLLDRYGLIDPVAVDAPGLFANSELQALYNELVSKGSRSLTEALEVGRTIETKDIQDLKDLLAISEHADVTRVVQNLLRGSEKHLAAFTRLL